MEALQEPILVAMSRYCDSRTGERHSVFKEAEEINPRPKRPPDARRLSASAAGGGPRADLEVAGETFDPNARLAVSSAICGRSSRQSPSKASATASPPLPSAAELEELPMATLLQSSSTLVGSKASDRPSSSSRSSLEMSTGPSPVAASLAPSPSPSAGPPGGGARVQRFARLLNLLVDVRDVGVQSAAGLLARSAETAHGQLFELYREMFDRVENLQPRGPTAPQ